MNRRDFVRFLALLAAGTAALPEQIEAYTRYYDLNTPKTGGPLVSVDEVMLSGLANVSTRIKLDIFKDGDIALPLAVNAFGGVIRWVAAPDQKIVAIGSELCWRFECLEDMPDFMEKFTGHISYIDGEGFRRTRMFVHATGSLAV